MYIIPSLHFAAFLAEVLLIILVISRNPRAQLNMICALLVSSLAIWSFFYGLANIAHTESEALFFVNCASVGICSFPSLGLCFYLVFTQNGKILRNRLLTILLVLLPVFFIYLQYAGELINQASKVPWGWSLIWKQSLFSYSYLAYLGLSLGVSAWLLIRYARTTFAYRQKRQARLQIIFGSVTVFLALSHGLLYQLAGTTFIPQVPDILALIWGVGMVFSISRYGMMSIMPAIAADEILGTMTDSIMLLDASGKIIYANEANLSLLGIKQNKLKGSDFCAVVACEGKAGELLADTASKGERAQRELAYVSVDGTATPCLVSATAIREPHHNISGYVVTAVDISERKRIEEQLIKSNQALRKTLNDAINTMTKIVEMRDPYTFGHQRRVTELAVAIAARLRMNEELIDRLRMAATVHDIGKIYVPADILSKPGKLSDIEFKMIQTHPQGGHDIVKSMDFPCKVAETILQHHERLDGSGYPQGLQGSQILPEAKILAVADIVEAMASHRPYRPALGIDRALEEVRKNRGRLYDTDAADACLQLFEQKAFTFEESIR